MRFALVGAMRTASTLGAPPTLPLFQSLVGAMRTRDDTGPGNRYRTFQSFVGAMRTSVVYSPLGATSHRFNPS